MIIMWHNFQKYLPKSSSLPYLFSYLKKKNLSMNMFIFSLHFESSSDASNWKMAIEEAITDALGDNSVCLLSYISLYMCVRVCMCVFVDICLVSN